MNIKNLKSIIPELLIFVSLLYYWIASSWLNPLAIGLLLIISFQILKQKVVSGIIIAFIFILLNLYMVLALISELSEFESANEDFKIMLIIGSLYLGSNITIGSFMLIKYIKKANVQAQETTLS